MPLVVATLVSAVVGYVSIWFLLAYLKRRSTLVFVIYRIVLGVILLVLLWQGIISPLVNT
jgi:undecaprenyl-diphosphatase